MKEVSLHMADIVPLMQESLAKGQEVHFSPRGISMLPMLRQGIDTVTLARVDGKLKKYDIPLYQRDNGAYVLHRITKVGETYTCIGDNQYEYEPGIRHDQVIAVVSAFSRNGKQISAKNFGYLVYTRLWHWSRWPRWMLFRLCRKTRVILRRIRNKK